MTFAQRLVGAWGSRGWLARLLWPCSLLFAALGALRRLLYRRGWLGSIEAPVPVVVVGNVYVGGTGKTPLVIWLVEQLRRQGLVPGVISRGHGAKPKPGDQTPAFEHVYPDSDPRRVGDEPLLIAQRTGCPVTVGRDRAAAAQALHAAHPAVTVIISDDGLQHYRLRRAFEIILFDQRGIGNGWLLPAGPLREAPGRARDVTVVNGAGLPHGVARDALHMELVGLSAWQLAERSRITPLHALQGPILAAAGIGNPERFFAMLRAQGLTISTLALPDHYDFAVNPFMHSAAAVILLTEKDAVKCARIDGMKNDPRLWVVPVTAQLDGALAELIVEKLRGYPIA
ncbi:MAG: tetraacyldisaccharide 4'-kinase [Pseudomonadota bacterium]|nr:tetraacyldisaccharide 4'-kinase [Pseudomonadota bacterium]